VPWAVRRRARIATAIAATVAVIAALLGLRAVLHVDALDQLHDEGGGRYTGSLHLPRPGRYVFGCRCDEPITIDVDGRRLKVAEDRAAGKRGASIDLDAGVAAFAVDAPQGARLLWHPPGRRGPLEDLPASSLSPAPPEAASFSAWAGAAPVDGAVALAILAALAGCALYLGAPRLGAAIAADRRRAIAIAAVFAVAAAARLWDLGGAGQTFDEDTNWSAGRTYVANLVALDFDQRAWVANYEHPPVMKYLAGIGAQLADGYGPARAISALLMAAACALLVAIGARLWSLRAGVAAGVIAALTPHLIAHGKVVGHEAPTVLWWTLGVWLALRAFDAVRDRADTARLIGRFAAIGVVLGLAVSSRFVNVLLAPLLGLTLLVQAPPGLRWRTVGLGLAILPAVAVATSVAVWPRLWSEPLVHLAESWATLSGKHAAEPFLGRWTNDPPPWYFLAYLGATAPLGALLAAGAGVARAAIRWTEWRATAVAVGLFAAPLVVMLSPVRQDGVRYVMPSVAALALLGGAGVDAAASWLARGRLAGHGRRVFAGVAAALAVYLAITCARVHPYYLDYYGEQVGGPAAVARRRAFEIGWWGEGVDRAVAHVAAHARPGDRVYRDCVEALHLAWWHADAWPNLVPRADQADWIVVQPAHRRCAIPDGAEVAYTVTAMGAPLVRVYRARRRDP
jgi:4-amino-4-deoxy-L-arabinose transferase-like glycosyltransferase